MFWAKVPILAPWPLAEGTPFSDRSRRLNAEAEHVVDYEEAELQYRIGLAPGVDEGERPPGALSGLAPRLCLERRPGVFATTAARVCQNWASVREVAAHAAKSVYDAELAYATSGQGAIAVGRSFMQLRLTPPTPFTHYGLTVQDFIYDRGGGVVA